MKRLKTSRSSVPKPSGWLLPFLASIISGLDPISRIAEFVLDFFFPWSASHRLVDVGLPEIGPVESIHSSVPRQVGTPLARPAAAGDRASLAGLFLVSRWRKVLFLDLDETLIHASPNPYQTDFVPHFSVTVSIHGASTPFYVCRRPFVEHFLHTLASHYELWVFTASISDYANAVIDRLDPSGYLISRRLFRDDCTSVGQDQFVKDLSKHFDDMARCMLLDNSPLAHVICEENAVPCTSFYGDVRDTELLDLLPFFLGLAHVEDVRSVLRLRTFARRG